MSDTPLARAHALLRESREAVLTADDRAHPCRYTLDGETGRPVASVPPAVLLADEHVLFVPDESPGGLQLLTIPEQIDQDSRPGDQWRAYFGKPTGGAFVRFAIDFGRLGPDVLDGDDLMQRNDLLGDVAALCRHFNRTPGAIRSLCTSVGCASPGPALLVGVDGYGFDVRTRFRVLRFVFGSRASNREDAARRIQHMIDNAERSQ
ncbi:hypothetical protein JYU07_00435 [Roseiflexus sp. AH-315-K22]|nr:hypothetical protein [Roseiflexus sp. AH-315-K22]